jgi:hypothetical protein
MRMKKQSLVLVMDLLYHRADLCRPKKTAAVTATLQHLGTRPTETAAAGVPDVLFRDLGGALTTDKDEVGIALLRVSVSTAAADIVAA